MTSYVPIVKNNANGAIFYISLAPRTANGQWQANPTLASGDVKISLDGGALANLNTLPVVTPASSKLVKVVLSQAETDADNIAIVFSDAAGAEWCDKLIHIQTVAKQFDDLAVQTDLTAVKNKTDSLNFTVTGMVDSNVIDWKGSAAPAMTGDAYARIGAAGAGLTALGDTRLAHLDVDVSSRSTYAGADTSGTTTLLSRLTSTRAGLLDHLDADISSRMATFSYTAPLDAAGTRAALGMASANLDTQIATLATMTGLSDLADGISASFTALQSHGDGAWTTASGFSTLDGSDVSAAVWDVPMADHLGAGTTGDAIFQAGTHAPSADSKADTIIADIAALNNLSAADVNAEVDSAIADAALATAASLATTDGKVDAVKAKTDQFAFTGGAVDSNIAKVNGVTVQGAGTSGNEWRPA